MILSMIKIQKALTQLGYGPGPIDGVHGPRTDEAVARWMATFAARYGTRPTFDTQADLRSADLSPSGAWGELNNAANAYDARMAAERATAEPRPTGGGGGGAVVALLALGGAAWWFSRRR